MSVHVWRWRPLAAALMAGCGGGSSAPSEEGRDRPDQDRVAAGAAPREERWQRDRDLFVARVEELHAKVEVQSADGDHAKQLEQARRCSTTASRPWSSCRTTSTRPPTSSGRGRAERAGHQLRPVDPRRRRRAVRLVRQRQGRPDAGRPRCWRRRRHGNYLLLGGSPTDNNAKLVRDGPDGSAEAGD